MVIRIISREKTLLATEEDSAINQRGRQKKCNEISTMNNGITATTNTASLNVIPLFP